MPRRAAQVFCCLAAIAALAGGAQAAEPRWPDVERWGRFERVVTNARTSADPAAEVALNVTYHSPDGRTVTASGFHEGGRAWRFRFMPDTLGTWIYRAEFSDGSAQVPSTEPKPISRASRVRQKPEDALARRDPDRLGTSRACFSCDRSAPCPSWVRQHHRGTVPRPLP